MSSLSVGQLAPPFSLTASNGAIVSLADFRGRRVVLYFYPKDDTPGCTIEACAFQGGLARLSAANAVVLGISRDDARSHGRFAEKFRLTFPLLSDPDAAVCKAYGVYKQKSMYGRTYLGIDRTTFIIDGTGRIATIFPKVSVNGHTEAVLEALGVSAPPARRAANPARSGAPTAARRRARPTAARSRR